MSRSLVPRLAGAAATLGTVLYGAAGAQFETNRPILRLPSLLYRFRTHCTTRVRGLVIPLSTRTIGRTRYSRYMGRNGW